ncbi:MAG: DEAD/DEAH box helicase [Chthoniobacterales bacterium]
MGLSPEVLKAVEKMGFEEASPIQSEAIPVLLSGQDVVGQSQTGSGKTAAFAIPVIERVDASSRYPQALILCPTRELAVQVAEEVSKLASSKRGVVELPIYGGASYERQNRGLRDGAQIIIGTPGRVMDHLDRGTLKLDQVSTIVLDEADRMLDMGFRDDIQTILDQTPEDRQTVFFSATMPRAIQELVKRYTRDPVSVRIETKAMSGPAIDQIYYEVDRRSKLEALCRIIDLDDVKCAIVFCATKMMCDQLAEHLIARGYVADKLHGDITQAARERVMKRFRERRVEFLVATDVAARGLDVDDIEVVFNYDLPHDGEDYVHRIGRTGRAGRSGRAITFVAGREIRKLENMIRYTKGKIRRERVPSLEELEEKRTNHTFEQLRETLESGDFTKRDSFVDRLLDQGHSPTDIASALMHLLMSETSGAASDSPNEISTGRPDREYNDRDDRPARGGRDRAPRERRSRDEPVEAGMTRLVFMAGRLSQMRPADIVGMITGQTQFGKEKIGVITIADKHTTVDVAEDAVQEVIAECNGLKFKGRKMAVFASN